MQWWQCVEEDFSSEDETSNFSNRKIFTAEDRIEEWLTLRTFETASKVLQRPYVRSATTVSGKICVAIDETVFVFNDNKCSDLIISINVGSKVDCCSFVDRANVLLVATRKGDVSCVSFQGHVLFVRTISTEICSEGYTFVNLFDFGAHHNRGTYNAVLVDHHGSIYSISWNEQPQMNRNVDVNIQILKDGKENNKVSSAILIPGTERTIAGFGENVTLWSGTSENICSFRDYDLQGCVKAQMWKEKFFVCLTSEGELALLCAKTLLCCTTWHKFTVQDFIIVKDENDLHKENIALLSALNNSSKCITILSLPDLKIKHEVKIFEMSWFISSPNTVMCIEGYSSSDNVVKLRIIILSKCHPRQRLQLCLKEHKFDEAEALARQFELDVEVVFKEKASFFVKTLTSQIDHLLFNDLISTLDQISDIQFVTSFCAEQCVCQMSDMKSMLRYALKRIQILKKPLTADIKKIYLKIYTKFHNLETISLIKEDTAFNSMKWRNILDIDWLKACFATLSNGNIEKAKFIWLRHLQDGQIIKEEEIKLLIVSISPSAKQSEVLKWLQLIIPYIQQYAPDIMECLGKWVVDRSKLMENDEQWPRSAINFVEEFYALTKKIAKLEEDKPFCFYGHNHKYLLSFLSDLQSIESLIKNYGIKIQLQDFLQENKLEVAKNILKRVTHHDVDRMLNGYMKNFIIKHNLSIDSVVLHFIEKLLSAVSDHWIHLSVSRWEPVMMTCISYVQSVQEKVKCILAALKFATIPWSDAMKKLAAEGCKLNHPQVIEIKRLEKLAEIKLVFKKYRLPTHLLGSSKLTVFIYLIRKIIMEAHDEMLKDALIIAEDSIKFQAEAHSMCLHYYILRKMCSETHIILENMDSQIFEMCTKRLLCRIEIETDLDVLYSYIDVMNSISFRLSSILNIRKDLEYIRNLHLLNLNFGYKVTFQDFSCEKKRYDAFKMWIKSLVISGLNEGCDVYSLCKDAKYIAQLCFFPSGDGLLEVFKHLSKETFINEGNQIMESLNARSSPYSKGKLQSFCKEKLMTMSGSNPDALACCKIMTDCILNERLSINDPWLHILSWINRARDVSRMSVCYKTEQMNDFRLLNVFQDCPGSAWKPGVIRFVQCVFQSMENNDITANMTLELQHLYIQLLEDGVSIMLIALLNMSKSSMELIHATNQNMNNTELKKILEDQLSILVCGQICDIHLAGGILVSLEVTAAESWLCESVIKFRTRFQKLERIAKLGIFFSINNKLNYVLQFKSLKAECLWARYLRRCNLFCVKALVEDKKEIVSKLIFEKDIETAEEFSKTFDVDFSAHLPKCLEYVILSWKPDFEIKQGKEGQRSLLIKNNEDDILDTCLIISEKMKKNDLKQCLQNITTKINFYYYEMYCCVNEVKKRLLQEQCSLQFLLLFLRDYLRSSPIQKEERDEWFLKYQCSHELPTIAEWRLPFWPNNMDKVIKSELTLNNYEQWLHMTGILKMPEDLIRVIVLKQLSNMPELTSNDADWCLKNLDEIIIDQIYNCAKGIVNQELACAVLYRVLRFTKCGAPKEQLAKIYSEFAKKRADSDNTNEAEQIMRNATQTYLDISTSNILYKYGINNSCYLEKISKPDVLVRELYAHPDIVNTNEAIKIPDINSAVNEISRIHDGIRWKELFLKLLEQWLAPANYLTGDKFDETITIQGNLQTLHDNEQNEIENFTRASYLLSKQDSDALLVTLLEVIFGNGKERSIQFKRNALTCIMSTLSMEEVSNLCGKAPDSIREHLKVLQFVSDLDSLGYIMTVLQFVNCKKYDLVMELISSGHKNRPVLSLAAQIALRFQILDSDIWGQLLKNMVQGCMSEDLEEVLGKLPPSTTGIVEAWTYVFFLPFRSCSIPLSDHQRRWCLNSIKLLYKCQVTDQIDLVQMGQFCCQFDSPHWAAMILPLASSDQIKILKKKILNNSSVNEVLHKLEGIEDNYILLRIKKILEETED